jgi:hypothetical protein
LKSILRRGKGTSPISTVCEGREPRGIDGWRRLRLFAIRHHLVVFVHDGGGGYRLAALAVASWLRVRTDGDLTLADLEKPALAGAAVEGFRVVRHAMLLSLPQLSAMRQGHGFGNDVTTEICRL